MQHSDEFDRLVQVNEMGKARFLFLRGDGGEMLQLYVKADQAEAFAMAKELGLGDFVGARGPLFRTRKGKRALKCEELRLLTKSIRPLPGRGTWRLTKCCSKWPRAEEGIV